MPLNADGTHISFGIGGKVMYYYLDFELGEIPPGQDPAFNDKSFEKLIGDASSGVYLYNQIILCWIFSYKYVTNPF